MKDNLFINKYPELVKEWDYDKNIDIDINTITSSSHKFVWWICEKKHSWKQVVNKRTTRNSNCQTCNTEIKLQTDSLAIKFPELLKEWDYNKNTVSPYKISYGSTKEKFWWICELEKHEYESLLTNKIRGSTCPYCFGRYGTVDNNFANSYPHLIKEWNFKKNDLLPFDVTPHSHHKIWWKCEKNNMNG